MPLFIPALLAGIGALGGALGNRKQTTQQTTNQTTNSSNTTNPVYGDVELDVRNNILRQLLGATEDVPDFTERLGTAGIQAINANDAVRRRMQQNLITSRGLGRTSAGVNTIAGGDQNRQNQIVQMMSQLPLQQEQIRSNRLGDLSRFFATLPVGTSSTGTSTTTGNATNTTPGNMAAGGLQSGGSIAAMLYGMGAFGK